MPVIIAAAKPEVALRPKSTSEPSERTLQLRELEDYAMDVVENVKAEGAATIDYSDSPYGEEFVGRLRSALARVNAPAYILVAKRRNTQEAVAWKERPEDTERLAIQRARGIALGASARRAAAAAAAPASRSAPRGRSQVAGAPVGRRGGPPPRRGRTA